MRLILLLIPICLLGACARPEAVRSVARSSLPIATQLELSAPRLEKRMALQQRTLAERSSAIDLRTAVDVDIVGLKEREWTLRKDDDRLRRLKVLRDQDEATLADPLAAISNASVVKPASNPVVVADLKKAIQALDRLSGPRQTNALELIQFAGSVRDELETIYGESGEE